MDPFYATDDAALFLGDCREVLAELPEAFVDTVITDPPYGLEFMGKGWDKGVPGSDFWVEVLRVAKPGAMLLAFGGTRTYHRLACAIEDAGWQLRDCLMWLYGTGFPKSHNIAKGIAKRRQEDVEPLRVICRFIRAAMDERNLKSRHLVQHFDDCNPRLIDHWAARDTDSQPNLPTPEQWVTLKEVLELGGEMDPEFERLSTRRGEYGDEWNEADVTKELDPKKTPGFGDKRFTTRDATERALSNKAAQWDGWGTALKPAWKPIVLAMKPLSSTFSGNALDHGVAGLNIDAARVPLADEALPTGSGKGSKNSKFKQVRRSKGNDGNETPAAGRWPANVVLDDEVGAALGGPARFFYCAKAGKKERSDYLTCDCQTPNVDEWVNEDRSRNEQTDVTSPKKDTSEGVLADDSDSSTALSGKVRTVRSRRGSRSTTETKTSSTTESRTSNSLQRRSISESTQDANSEKERGGNRASSVKNSNPSVSNTGISPEKGGHSTGVVVPVTSGESLRKSVCERCGARVRSESHPTQKPVALMRWLARLTSTPEGGLVLDPFMGSGSTGIAALAEGRQFCGIELGEHYAEIATRRLEEAEE